MYNNTIYIYIIRITRITRITITYCYYYYYCYMSVSQYYNKRTRRASRLYLIVRKMRVQPNYRGRPYNIILYLRLKYEILET